MQANPRPQTRSQHAGQALLATGSVLFLALPLYSCQPVADSALDTFSAPDEPGPYAVSATTLTWTDARGRDLVAEVWYPVALNDDGTAPCQPHAYADIPITGQACRDEAPAAPPAEGFPVVAFSHGNGGIRFQSVFLTEVLAQHGYVVVAPDHPFNTLLDFDESQFGSVAMRRPGDITSAVDELERRSSGGSPSADGGHDTSAVDLSGLADTSRYGMSGHSFAVGPRSRWPAGRSTSMGCAPSARTRPTRRSATTFAASSTNWKA